MYNSDQPTRADLPSTAQLVRSTLIAAGIAIVILVTAVLPGEYGIDPTGIGRVLGFTQMGEIKQQLSAEVAAVAAVAPAVDAPPPEVAQAGVAESAPVKAAWRDEVSLTLAPGEAAEVKLVMTAGQTAQYTWTTASGHLNSDLHGDGKGDQTTSYRKGKAETADSGELTAAFDGVHGWFWRNRSDVPAAILLQVRGEYSEIKRVL